MKRLALSAVVLFAAACGTRSEEAVPAADTAASAMPAPAMDSAAPMMDSTAMMDSAAKKM